MADRRHRWVWVALADATVKVSLEGVEDGADLTRAAYLELGLDKKGAALMDVRLFCTEGGVRGCAISPRDALELLPLPGSTVEATMVAAAPVNEADDVLRELRRLAVDVKAVLQAQAADDKSYMSPTGREYEALASTKSDGWLRDLCGLDIVSDSRRGVADTDPSSGGMQWDARLAVTCVRDWTPPTMRAANFVVFGGLDFARPALLPAPRNMSPGKPIAAEYLALLEFTRVDNWYETWRSESGRKVRKGLLGRFEQRLAVCVQRARAAEPRLEVNTALDVVALVGVVGEFACKEGVEALLAKSDCPFPELQRMFKAHRFVFFYCAPMLPTGAPLMGVPA